MQAAVLLLDICEISMMPKFMDDSSRQLILEYHDNDNLGRTFCSELSMKLRICGFERFLGMCSDRFSCGRLCNLMFYNMLRFR